MIRVNVIADGDNYKQITLKGHAMYADSGYDIVCASVSATYLCTVNAILSINSECIDVIQGNDINIINIVTYDSIAFKLLDNMIRCLKDIERQYPNNIKIK